MIAIINKCHIVMKPIITVEWTLLVLQILMWNIESYNLKCPSQADWKFRAIVKCNNTLKYFCLYNNVDGKYVEGCNGPDWDRKGSKRIYAGDFTRGDCIPGRFQPFKFWTNESMSDCIYDKSICSEEGQILYEEDSTKEDRTCRCDFKRNYSFIITPKSLCSCIPTEEDCSCYLKSCPVNYTLSADYECLPKSYQQTPKCINIRYSEIIDKKEIVFTQKNNSLFSIKYSRIKWSSDTSAATGLYCLCLICIIFAGGFFFIVLFEKWTSQQLQSLNMHIKRKQTVEDAADVKTNDAESVDTVIGHTHESSENNSVYKGQNAVRADIAAEEIALADTVDGNKHSSVREHNQLTTDEVNFLRMIHLLFRVACPVVRMKFNLEIKPDQLRKILDKNQFKMNKRYRKKEIINCVQWELLYPKVKEKAVTSEDFDIRLMIYILREIANISVGDLYPVQSDLSMAAMLSRIKYIRNEATQSYEGKLSDRQFNQYWDDIGQAALKLVSSHVIEEDKKNKYDKEKTQLIGRLRTLNPIHIDINKLCLFIDMSEKYPARILQQLISEYCTLYALTIEDLLRAEKHGLYHKRIKTTSCCKCSPDNFPTFIKVIPEKQWEALFEIIQGSNSNCCRNKKCSEIFIPKNIDTCNLSVAVPLVLNIPSILKLAISRLCRDRLDEFVMKNKHIIFHSTEKKCCCECNQVPTEKAVISKLEWNKLFTKNENKFCRIDNKDCYCQYSVKKGIKYSDIEEVSWSKLFHVAGPISVLNKIRQDAFLNFLNWTVDDRPLRGALTELLCMIEDKALFLEMMPRMSSCDLLEDNLTKPVDAQGWVSRYVQPQKGTTESQFQILLPDKDGFNVKSIQIPKDFPLPDRTRYFKDLTDEENYFLLVVHGLTTIVYSVIQNQFNTRYPELDKIRMDIYEQQKTRSRKDLRKEENKSQQKKIYLTQKQQGQLFSPQKEESKNLDLKLMIYILRRRTEEEGKTDYGKQLDVINDIRREIVQSSSGVLNEKRFHDILESLRMAVLYFGGKSNAEKLLHLQHIKNILVER